MAVAKTKQDYKRKITEYIEDLTSEELRLLTDFVEYLHDKAAWEETQAILADGKLMKDLEEAEKDWNNGDYDGDDYVDWEAIKKEAQ